MFDYMVLNPKIEDLERRLIGVATGVDAYSETVAKHVNDLKDRVAELEKKLAANVSPITFLACPKCGHDTQHKPTGKILTSMPPQTEVKCVGCGLTRGVQ
jgi:hypothetical protein